MSHSSNVVTSQERSASQAARVQVGRDNWTERTVGGHHYRHGRPASWVLVGFIIAAFVACGFALVWQQWWLFWTGAGIVVLSMPVGKIIGIMDDTVMVGNYLQEDPPAADRGSVADPGVRME